MWAAANDNDARRRRRNYRSHHRHHTNEKRRPSNADTEAADDGGGDNDDDDDDDEGKQTTQCDYDGDSDSTTLKSPHHHHDSMSSGRGNSSGHHRSSHNNDDARRKVGGTRKRSHLTSNGHGNIDNTHQDGGGDRTTLDGNTRQKKIKRHKVAREETPEAAVSRLQTSYSTSMAAVGALHRLSRQLCGLVKTNNDAGGNEAGVIALPDNNDDEEGGDDQKEAVATHLTSLKRVAYAARCAFERTLLLDPVILASIFLSRNSVATNSDKKIKNAVVHGASSSSRIYVNVDSTKDGENVPSSAWLDTWNDHRVLQEGSNSAIAATTSNQLILQCTRSWNKFSEAQRRVIRQLSYLSLVNYADLLLCGCVCHRHCAQLTTKNVAPTRGDILDRGAVSNLQILNLIPSSLFTSTAMLEQETIMTDDNNEEMNSTSCESETRDRHSKKCLWLDNEYVQTTVRLALAAYCDASELDSTDPTLWFKLACAARTLGRMTDFPSSSTFSSSSREPQEVTDVDSPPPRSYRSLERLALERGLSSLPRGVPPNRLLVRAWKEMEDWDRKGCFVNVIEAEMDHSTISDASGEYSSELAKDQPTELVLHLPEYSWVSFCRILIQASKEGASYGRVPVPGDFCRVPHVWSTNCHLSEDYEFGSPLVEVRLSLLLGVPIHVLGLMCAYMEESDIKMLVATCKAMPKTVSSAVKERMSKETMASASSRNDAFFEQSTGSADEEEKINCLDNETKDTKSEQSRRGRVSTRVRSHLITTEKQAERKSNRSSLEYCLLAGVLSCTSHNPYYSKMSKKNQPAACRTPVDGLNCSLDADARPSDSGIVNMSYSPASLNEFIRTWSRRNSGPRSLLHHLVIHISFNIVEVFGGKMTHSLSSCVIDCFDTILLSAESIASGSHWYGAETFTEAGDLNTALTVFAVNLLNAELRFMRCESSDLCSDDHKESDFLAFVIPNLLQFASESSEFVSCRQLTELRLRTYWLACSYYFWVGRCTDSSIAKAAEDTACNYLNKATLVLSDKSLHGLKIKTPHLDHWHEISAEALAKYKEHIHSSAVVSQARQYFIEAQIKIRESGSRCDYNLDADIREKFAMLGSELLERFNVGSDNFRKNVNELLSDFRLIHEDDLFSNEDVLTAQSLKTVWEGKVHWGKIWKDIPSCIATFNVRDNFRPSIIQILATSLMASDDKTPSLLLIYSKVALAALFQFSQHMLKAYGVPQDRSDPIAETSDDNECTTIDILSKSECSLLRIANFFSDKLTENIASITSDSILHHVFETCFAGEGVMHTFIFESFNSLPLHQMNTIETILYTHHIKSVSRLVHSLRASKWLSRNQQENIESNYFVALVNAFITQKMYFVHLKSSTTDKRTKKWQTQVASKAEIVYVLASEVAELLSLNPSVVCANGVTRLSHLINALRDLDTTKESYSVLAQFIAALLWFWEFLHDASTPANMLMVPISSSIIALCGSHGVSMEGAICNVDDGFDKGIQSLSDYFDSDDSVNGSFLADDSSEVGEQRYRKLTLRKICQLVQCVSIVFNSIEHKAIEQSCPSFPSSCHGPFLPLVVVRVLSNMSQGLFQLFSQDTRGDAYPFGARECGATIDNLLGKAYRFLYGFSFSSGDTVLPRHYAPESIEAAISVFYCIKRVYRDSRKASPPSKAFEIIGLALPTADEDNVSKAIKTFLFDVDKEFEEKNNPLLSPISLPPGFPEWVFDAESNIGPADERQNDIEQLRRGVAHELAKGSMNNFHSPEQPQDDTKNQSLSAERELTQSHELSLYQKFRAVLNDLCYDPKNIERWVVLSECLGFKADIICDRLVRVQNQFDSSEFGLNSKSKREYSATLSLDQLKVSQLEEYRSRRKNWKPFLGRSLHVYMQYSWSNLTSLEACAKEVMTSIYQSNENDAVPVEDSTNSDYLCWEEIQSKFVNGNYTTWANSWGGLFVMALRKMRLKALLVARHLAKNSQKGMHPSEVCEDLGTALYGDLMASTVYGYPIHVMTPYEKRTIAECSNLFFQEAIELAACNEYSQKCHIKPFESHFMIGKGHEKIASTLRDEDFVIISEGVHKARLYETKMNDAIQSYAMAISKAQSAELSPPEKVCYGGSSHGALECLYRLHASRFKVLLNAVTCAPSECELTELEAFRIVSSMWFCESHVSSPSAGIREKAWDIFADCVDAFSHMIEKVPLFHRATYRLCQAYSYAPLIHNPNCDLIAGSKHAVPATKSCKVRGLDTGSCAESASVAISKLFDKRRSQLCSVWVTTSAAPSPFEVINDSFRKYDALRMKYIIAFVECMRVTKRIDNIETLLTWTSSSKQDLPGFYESSASLRGLDPGKHTKQSYLSTRGFIAEVKRITSDALAKIILSDLADMKRFGIGNDWKKKLNSHFQLSHRLFLLLNSSCKQVAEFARSNNHFAVVDAFGKCFLAIQAGYRISSIDFEEIDTETMCSILECASAKAKSMMQEAKTVSSKKDKE